MFYFTCDRSLRKASSVYSLLAYVVLVVAVCYLGHPKNWLIDWLIEAPAQDIMFRTSYSLQSDTIAFSSFYRAMLRRARYC